MTCPGRFYTIDELMAMIDSQPIQGRVPSHGDESPYVTGDGSDGTDERDEKVECMLQDLVEYGENEFKRWEKLRNRAIFQWDTDMVLGCLIVLMREGNIRLNVVDE